MALLVHTVLHLQISLCTCKHAARDQLFNIFMRGRHSCLRSLLQMLGCVKGTTAQLGCVKGNHATINVFGVLFEGAWQ